MGSITSLKCVLTQEHLDAICAKYFVPEEVHPQLPSSDATMHERPTGKVGMYTRFFDYANYRIPFSTFFVSVLTHFRIPFSQLSVFGSAKGLDLNPVPPEKLSGLRGEEYCWGCKCGDGGDQGFDFVVGQGNEGLPVLLKTIPSSQKIKGHYGTSAGVPHWTLLTLPFINFHFRGQLHPLEEGGDRTDSALNLRSLKLMSLVSLLLSDNELRLSRVSTRGYSSATLAKIRVHRIRPFLVLRALLRRRIRHS
ncbi:hypothetical protein Tco_0273918 [Tanacetum coccineum]